LPYLLIFTFECICQSFDLCIRFFTFLKPRPFNLTAPFLNYPLDLLNQPPPDFRFDLPHHPTKPSFKVSLNLPKCPLNLLRGLPQPSAILPKLIILASNFLKKSNFLCDALPECEYLLRPLSEGSLQLLQLFVVLGDSIGDGLADVRVYYPAHLVV
jgi:hypothetical protein